jgi:hypothetical protein
LRGPLYPDEPTCSGCPQSMYASSAPSLSANVGLALPAFARRKKRRARDATHTSGLFVLNSIFLRMNQAHRSAFSSRQRFDRPPPHQQKAAVTVGPLAASVRTEASVTPGALKPASAKLARKRLHPLCRTKITRITGRASTLHVVDQARLLAICANYAGHVLRIYGVPDSHYGYV